MCDSIRPATITDAAGIARVHVESWRTTYRGIVPNAFLDSLSIVTSETRWKTRFERNSITYAMFVAEDEAGHIVGFADGGPERSGNQLYHSELYAIYLLQSAQGKGIGRQLFQHVVRHLKNNAFSSMLIWALSDNPACHFYEALGGLAVRQTTIEIGGKELPEVAYGWSDLSKV